MKNVRLDLTSATLNLELFSSYFGRASTILILVIFTLHVTNWYHNLVSIFLLQKLVKTITTWFKNPFLLSQKHMILRLRFLISTILKLDMYSYFEMKEPNSIMCSNLETNHNNFIKQYFLLPLFSRKYSRIDQIQIGRGQSY